MIGVMRSPLARGVALVVVMFLSAVLYARAGVPLCPATDFAVTPHDPPASVLICTPGQLAGPCVAEVGDSGMWIYTPAGSVWPQGHVVSLCPPAPCVWVGPDSTVYLWEVPA
jgi:hypothetical protein